MKTIMLTARLPRALLVKLTRAAKRERVTRTALLVRILKRELAK